MRLLLLLTLIRFSVVVITAKAGQKSVTLTCRIPNNNLIAVEWSRADLGEKYVLLYRDGHFEPRNQHPSFKNRVDLQDRQMKDGDVSLILKDVTIDDTGTYECRVFVGETSPWKSISIIYLSVVAPPGQTGGDTEDGGKEAGGKKEEGKEAGGKEDGSVGLIVGLSVSAVLLVAAVFNWVSPFLRKYQKVLQVFHQIPDPDSGTNMSVFGLSEETLVSETVHGGTRRTH
ncbi:putative butyrophilin subfamily 2 member A3 [Oreochromis aureus]|uniref:putative butyrophilin subfamily 2 member A3 n=1 Tax=Oreochromis aureus TaxID=47969 RepID=UPI001954EB39|nr:putative butyrophilin subfamily 2 member A3 [Oreochromis aureus]